MDPVAAATAFRSGLLAAPPGLRRPQLSGHESSRATEEPTDLGRMDWDAGGLASVLPPFGAEARRVK
jgi:hypothetical protein